jgi:tetratricopeptide (TPR) repeat protein/TolB-like protein/tRNA A-37 threonylcarbamoyl transferase component Bud32
VERETSDPRPRAAPVVEPAFGVDDLIAGRYRVRRFLGRGASGEVYAVTDLELGAEIALKALRPAGGDEGISTERFRREVLLARRVSHPNVCRIFDLGVHLLERAGAAPRPVRFLTMELLEGRTLLRRIEEEGPLAEVDAVAIARQLCAALAAAHDAGVVHRDFKSSNVLLVGGPGGERAVVTDFGLARDNELPSGASNLTGTGGVLGTPAYMAPEQVEGRRATARSDLYALGVVLYETVTGRLPFEGESPLSVAVKRLQAEPTPIEEHRADLSPRFRSVVRRLLEREPAERFADAREVPCALDGELAVAAPRRRRRRRIAVAAAVAVLAAAGLTWRLARSAPAKPEAAAVLPAPVRERASIAVIGLRNAAGAAEAAWLSGALAEMLTSELAVAESLRVVPGETVARALADLGIAPQDAFAPATLERLRRALGVRWVVAGAYTALGERAGGALRLDLRLQRTDGGAGERSLPIEGSEAGLFDLVSAAGRGLREALGAREPAAGVAAGAREALPATGEAVRLYADGLARLRAGEPLPARELLEAAVAEDPESALAWSALARAWQDLGYAERAREAAETAWRQSARLARSDALAVEARYRLAAGDTGAAIENLRALWRFYPDDPEQGLALADALVDADRAREALSVVGELRDLPGAAREDPRIDLVAARSAEGLSDFVGQLEAARSAAAKAAAAGARHLAARARWEEGLALRKLGRAAESRKALLEARRVFAEVGDRAGVARSLLQLADLERVEGRLDEAAALYAEAHATYAAIGNRPRQARVELMQGVLLAERGDVAGAAAAYESALAKLREAGDRRGAAAALANLGSMRYEQGDLDGALERQRQALGEFRALGDEARTLVSLQNHAMIHQERGDFAAAEAALGEALAIARRIGDRTGEGYVLKGLADLATERGDFDGALARYDQAHGVFRAAGQEIWVPRVELAAALAIRDRGDAAAAERELERLAAAFERLGSTAEADEARLERVRALARLGRRAEAAALLDDVAPRGERSETRRIRQLTGLARGELALADGDHAGARERFAALLEESRHAGQVVRALEARVALASVAAAAHDAGAPRLVEEAIAEARRIGCGRLLARLDAAGGAKPSTPRL